MNVIVNLPGAAGTLDTHSTAKTARRHRVRLSVLLGSEWISFFNANPIVQNCWKVASDPGLYLRMLPNPLRKVPRRQIMRLIPRLHPCRQRPERIQWITQSHPQRQ
jgi:hypothetical protein